MTLELAYAALGAGGAILGGAVYFVIAQKLEAKRHWNRRLEKNIEDVRALQLDIKAITATTRALERALNGRSREDKDPR